MVLKKALLFVASSLTPRASNPSKGLELRSPEGATSPAEPKPRRLPTQQELELEADFRAHDEEEKTQSCQSEDESETSAVPGELIEISLGEVECHQQQHLHYLHGSRLEPLSRLYSASELETIDELIELAKEGNLPAFKRACEALAKQQRLRPDAPGYMGWTPAHWAAREGHVAILDYLLASGVGLEARDKKGDSVLHKAAANGQYRACQWLLQCGFDAQATNHNGRSALDVAQERLAIARTSEAALCEAILAREGAGTF
ncbi:hypothetical protein PybrP1_008523 [[Pythium] brassicae (nom. inval.)]|nr:hypothetical protein PybrP1_008523 [[Pythium] brassicae (nom. inval.)]